MEDALQRQSILSEPKQVATNDSTAPDVRFTALVKRQSNFIFRIAYAVLRNPEDAEDVVQETFLKLYRNRGWLDIQDEPRFLARVAWRIAVGRVRSRRQDSLEMEMPSQGRNPEEAAMEADWDAIVHRLIDTLPEDLRQPLVLSALEELDSPQIGAIMGIPEGTVRTRLLRARSILKQKLARFKEGHYAG